MRWFFNYFDFPKLLTQEPIQRAIRAGTADAFGYVPAAEVVDGELRPQRASSIWFGSPIDQRDIELGSGAFIIAPELVASLQPTPQLSGSEPPPSGSGSESAADSTMVVPMTEPGATPTHASIRTTAGSAEQLFRLTPGVQNLADGSKRIVVRLEIEAGGGPGIRSHVVQERPRGTPR